MKVITFFFKKRIIFCIIIIINTEQSLVFYLNVKIK